jgi:hypothetical protein
MKEPVNTPTVAIDGIGELIYEFRQWTASLATYGASPSVPP